MQYRIVERRLRAQGCSWKQGKGDHIKWFCPCGQHIAVLERKERCGMNQKGKVEDLAPAVYTVTAKKWMYGWELHIDGIGVTQSKTLGTADQVVRDYIETLTDMDVSDSRVVVIPELGDLDKQIESVRQKVAEADRLTQEASAARHKLATDLRAAGLSVTDVGVVLGVSRGRVSQISKAS